jgi:hypothetical protein
MFTSLRLTFLLALGLFIISCKNSTPTKVTDNGYAYYGAEITDAGAISFDQMLLKMADADTIAVKVKGKIEGVCQAKGCWMNITSSNTDKSMFVKFKDYGFFMPLDASGQTAIMNGKAYREITSVEELKHYAEDEGQSAEEIAAITEPIEELKFMADGVILLPRT